jgi:multidrug transporter EmrE-like cation transporter
VTAAVLGAHQELVGAVVAALSALLYDAGYVLEKRALVDLPPMKLSPAGLLRTARASRRWTAGFAAMLAGLGLQVVALTLAPVSIVQPILAGGLIALAAAGSSLLGERLNRRHALALALVLLAVVSVAGSARGSAALARHVPAGPFFLLAMVVSGAALLAGRAGLGRRRRGALRGLAGTALAAGLLYGLGAVAEKAVATRLVSRGLLEGAWSALSTPYPWIFLAATLAGMLLFQVGLQANPASLMASLTNVTSTVCALVGASLVFGEGLLPPSGWWAALRVAGFVCVIASVALLTGEGGAPGPPGSAASPDTVAARPDHAVAP